MQTDQHELLDGALVIETAGIIGRCTCGWNTGHRFSSMLATIAFRRHQERVREAKGGDDEPTGPLT